MLILAACGTTINVVPTLPPPTAIPTPLSTPLPTVSTQIPFGLPDLTGSPPYIVALMLPANGNPSGADLQTFLNKKTAYNFKVNMLTSDVEQLAALCSGTPTFGWVDGWTLLAAQAQGCGQPTIKIQQNTANGIRADIVVSSVTKYSGLSALRQKEFCRLRDDKLSDSQSITAWILPVLMLRSAGNIDPFKDLATIKSYPDIPTMLKDVAGNKCAAGIPSGTLSQYTIEGISDPTKAINVLATSAEVPFGGLIVSARVPNDIADQVTKLFLNNPDQLKGFITADRLAETSSIDYKEALDFLDRAGFDLKSIGQQ